VTEERLARLSLAAAVEPDDGVVQRLVDQVGAVEAVARLRRPAALGRGQRRRPPPPEPGPLLRSVELTGARWVVPGDPEWPTQVDDLGAARPFGLWVRGEELRRRLLASVAIVGARAATGYGVDVARAIAAGLADRGWTVLSGGAYGIDAAAHRGALAAGGCTVAVLAGGPDQLQPVGNHALLQAVIASGAVVGELPCGRRPSRSRLLARNRLIAALTRGTVIVEAAERSGTSRTAADAARLRRALMAVPGPVTSALSVGCHRLLRDSEAILVASASDVLQVVGPLGEPEPAIAPVGPAALVLAVLPERGGLPMHRLCAAAGLSTADALAALDELSTAGQVIETPDGWRRAGP
jgi:DNA processing protein